MAAQARFFAAFLLGIATVFGFAPFAFSALPVVTVAGLFLLWQSETRATAAAWTGFAFGLGLFGAGISWIYIALSSDFGGMPAVLAALGIAGFCAYLALWPALAGWIAVRVAPSGSLARLLAATAAWTVAEWLRGWVFSGFGWLSLGYAQVHGPLRGYAPVGGTFLVSMLIAATAALAVCCVVAVEARRMAMLTASVAAIAALWIGGIALSTIEWSRPLGDPIAVSLVQGNIDEDLKFDPEYADKTLAIYADLAAEAKGRLIVLPESALPMFADEVPVDYTARLRAMALKNGGDLLVGLFFFEERSPGEDEDRYFNSVVSQGTADTQIYRKHHLVPFGETIPAKAVVGWLIRSVLHIPLADQTPGPAFQEPFNVAGQRVAVNICYEDAFGSEIRDRLPDATMLVNVTNDAWYGRSLAAEQHDQISAMRALETARPMLRATNTGITAIIDHRGVEVSRLPWFTRGVLEGVIAGREGVTPYVRYGDGAVVLLALAILCATFFYEWRAARTAVIR
jgi:apolipoprotein N-acyltransferase